MVTATCRPGRMNNRPARQLRRIRPRSEVFLRNHVPKRGRRRPAIVVAMLHLVAIAEAVVAGAVIPTRADLIARDATTEKESNRELRTHESSELLFLRMALIELAFRPAADVIQSRRGNYASPIRTAPRPRTPRSAGD